MTHEERVATIQRGVTVLRAVERELRSALPAARGDAPLLREIREVMSLADRLEPPLTVEGADVERTRDALLTGASDAWDDALLARWGEVLAGRGDSGGAAALDATRALLARYRAAEFMPSDAWYGLLDDDAPAV
jgi:hypothetical protein